MADVSKIKLPDNTEVTIKDSRIAGVDTTVTSGSSNVITSGAVYTAISNNSCDAKVYVVEPTYEQWDENSFTITTQMFDSMVDDAENGRSVVLRFHITGSEEGYNEVYDYALTFSESSNNYWWLQFNRLHNADTGCVLSLSKEGSTVYHSFYSHTFELVGNRVTSVSSTSSNSTYPTSKAVYNAVQEGRRNLIYTSFNVTGWSDISSGNYSVTTTTFYNFVSYYREGTVYGIVFRNSSATTSITFRQVFVCVGYENNTLYFTNADNGHLYTITWQVVNNTVQKTFTDREISAGGLPTPTGTGLFLETYYDSTSQTNKWGISQNISLGSGILDLSSGNDFMGDRFVTHYGPQGDASNILIDNQGLVGEARNNQSVFSDWSWIKYRSSYSPSAYVTLDSCVLPPASSSISGCIPFVDYNTPNWQWKASDFIIGSGVLESGAEGGFRAWGTSEYAELTAGQLFNSWANDWSWIKIEGTGQTYRTLQDELDSIALPSVTSSDYGRLLYVGYNQASGYHWSKESPFRFASYYAELDNGWSFGVYNTSFAGISLDPGQGIVLSYVRGGSAQSYDWSWLKYRYYSGNTTVTVNLQDTLDTKQDLLVSGTNIKTINNQSLLGSGNITISGGGDNLPDVTSSDFGRMLWVDYDSTNGYHWSKNSPFQFGSYWLYGGQDWGIALRDSAGSFTDIAGDYIRNTSESTTSHSPWSWIWSNYYDGTIYQETDLQSYLDLKAPLASPTLTGVPTAPTAASGTNTTQIATTAFVQAAVSGGGGSTTDCVHKTGNETVGGDKTFTDDIIIGDASNIKYGASPSQGFTRGKSSQWWDYPGANSIAIGDDESLAGEPKAFILTVNSSNVGSGVLMVIGDSAGVHGIYNTGSQHNYSAGFTKSYSNGILTITAPTGVTFISDCYYDLVYYYGGGSLTFKTSQVQPGSGVTAVTFTGNGLTEVPAMYACFLETAVNNEQYRRVAGYTNSAYSGSAVSAEGITFLTGGPVDTTSSFSASYNNGLVINSGGTNAGGYFHNPGTYTLYYLMASDIGGGGGSYSDLADELSDIKSDITALETGKQDTLVSGTSIKTINSTSLLGSGNIAISSLPTVTTTNNGQLLEVSSGAWAAGRTITISSSEPTAYQGNNGDIWIVI